MNKISRVMLVEDNPEYRRVIQIALKADPAMELIDTLGTAERAISRLHRMSPGEFPDVILLDLNLPGMSGIDALPDLVRANPETKIIILTQSNHEADVLRAISLGAAGYLLKSSSVNEIKNSIQTVAGGGASLDPSVAKFILSTLRTVIPSNEMDTVLTERELEILTLLADGFVKKEIGHRLDISYNTVVTHVARIYEKLHVENSPAAVAKAFRTGIFPIDRD